MFIGLTVWSVFATRQFGFNVKLLMVLTLPVPIALYPVGVIGGSIMAACSICVVDSVTLRNVCSFGKICKHSANLVADVWYVAMCPGILATCQYQNTAGPVAWHRPVGTCRSG